MSLPKTYKQAAFHETGGSLVVSEVPLKEPGAGEILIKVEACGVCHSDVQPQNNLWGAGFPMVPGHEVIGTVAAVGEGVGGWKQGDRIGAAWHGGMCNSCDMCKQGLYQFCAPYQVNGVTQNGGCRPAVLELNTFELLTRGGTVQCFPVGNFLDVEETLRFADLQGLESIVETFPLDDAQKAFDHMLSGKVRFRAVITMC